MQNILLEESASTTSGYRLSPQQKQVWQAQQHSAQALLAVKGKLDVERLRAAVRAVVARHEILRTSFPRQPGMRTPMQVIHDEPVIAWREDDFTEASDAQQRLAEAVVKDETLTTVPETGPCFRVALVQLAAEDYRLVLTMPSLCADEASLTILATEIFADYTAPQSNESEPVQYIQFSEWQHELAESEDTEAGRAFWLTQQTATGPSLPFSVSPSVETTKQVRSTLKCNLDRVADQCNVPAETVLLACWVALLWRLNAQETFSVTCVFNGRHYEELQGSVGLFARALPLASNFDEQQTFAGLVQQIEQRRLEAMEWQEYFESHADMAAGVGFEYVEHSRDWMSAGSLQWTILETRSEIHRPRLGLRCVKTGAGVELELTSDDGTGDVERLLSRMQLLVEAAVENVNAPIVDLPIVDETEWAYLVQELSHSDHEAVNEPDNFIEQFEKIAERFSDQPAVVSEDEELTYGELDCRSNQLAHYLRSLGVGPETRVAICMKRSAKMVLALLGVLKAGGAYVPLDFTYSRKQLAFMLEDAGPLVVLTEQGLLAALPEHAGRNVCLDSEWSMIATESSQRLLQISSDENLAYVIYTSGSTGAPKGVGIEHRQLQNYLRSIRPRLDLPAGATYATVSTFAADLGNTVIFPALATGGCLHVISQDRATNPDALAEYFDRHEIDCMKIVPSHLQALLETSTPANVLPRRCLVLGGEALRADLVRRIQELTPGCRIINHYGPTETTVGVLSYPVTDQLAEAALPLGRPLAGSQVYLLDRNLAPAPFGTAATIYVGGEGVSRGYLNRPELTAERFVANPFGPAGTRLYNTGDLARFRRDGNIEFLGRNDNQVKIHGYRVELGEIESALVQHESVREAVVIVREDDAGDKRLAAYLVCGQEHTPTAAELRQFLIDRVAAHLVPADFVLLKSLPLNPNGKMDRRALLEVEGVSLELNRSFVAPRTEVEEVLAVIWSDVLRKERVGVEDNFFALGGHSLAAMQVMTRIRKVFQVELSLRTVFESTSVALLAQAIVQNETEPGLSERKARVWKKLAAMSPEEKEALRNRQKERREELVGA
jgi:amino acid adenylation domain-containing protein